VTIAIEPKNPPKSVVERTTACTRLFRITAGCGSTVRLGAAGGSVDFCMTNSGKPITIKMIPEMIPAAGAIVVAHAVTIIGPSMKTISSMIASKEYAVLTK
jgi:hypothetical protein